MSRNERTKPMTTPPIMDEEDAARQTALEATAPLLWQIEELRKINGHMMNQGAEKINELRAERDGKCGKIVI